MFLCRDDGSRVAVAHAGWRGLAAGRARERGRRPWAAPSAPGACLARAGHRPGRLRGRPRGPRGLRAACTREARDRASCRGAAASTWPTSTRSRGCGSQARGCGRLGRRLLHLHRARALLLVPSREAERAAGRVHLDRRRALTRLLDCLQLSRRKAPHARPRLDPRRLPGRRADLGAPRLPGRVPRAGAPGAHPRELRRGRAAGRRLPGHRAAPVRADDGPRRDGRTHPRGPARLLRAREAAALAAPPRRRARRGRARFPRLPSTGTPTMPGARAG